MKQKREPIPVLCGKCRYVWNTRSTMFFVTCPRCGAKVKLVTNGETRSSSQ